MRIRLEKGRQKELILLAKQDVTWETLAKRLNLTTSYLASDLKNEERLISEESYRVLCDISGNNFDKYIIEKVDNNWGRSKGGKSSEGNTKEFTKPKRDKRLAELFGIILGDGHIEERISGKKIRVYCVNVAGNSKTDADYILRYIPNLFKTVFRENGSVSKRRNKNCAYFNLHGKRFVEFLKENGLSPGNKVKNNVGIPEWIKENPEFLKRCLRGLIDTDGSVQMISRDNHNIRIDFTNHSKNLLVDTRNALIFLGFSPSKIIKNHHFFLSRQEEIVKYMKEIGFSNSKNLKRVEFFLSYKKAPLV